MNKVKIKTNEKQAPTGSPATNSNVKAQVNSQSVKKAKRKAAKELNQLMEIRCTNGKVLLTRSSNGKKNEVTKAEVYTDAYIAVAWNPSRIRNISNKHSAFAKRYGSLDDIG